jgi:hypothetical protein
MVLHHRFGLLYEHAEIQDSPSYPRLASLCESSLCLHSANLRLHTPRHRDDRIPSLASTVRSTSQSVVQAVLASPRPIAYSYMVDMVWGKTRPRVPHPGAHVCPVSFFWQS